MEWIIDILKGAGSIILAFVPLLIPQVRELIILKYQHSKNQALEKAKAEYNHTTYVSRIRFDKEFELYAELSDVFFELVVVVNDSIPPKGIMFKVDTERYLDKKSFKIRKIS